jgi:hypothetical protein
LLAPPFTQPQSVRFLVFYFRTGRESAYVNEKVYSSRSDVTVTVQLNIVSYGCIYPTHATCAWQQLNYVLHVFRATNGDEE